MQTGSILKFDAGISSPGFTTKIPAIRFQAWRVKVSLAKGVGLRESTLYNININKAQTILGNLGIKEIQINADFDLLNLVPISQGIEKALGTSNRPPNFLNGWTLKISKKVLPGKIYMIDNSRKILTFSPEAGNNGREPKVDLTTF